MHTVITAFTDRAAAQSAMERLGQSGVSRHDMHLEHRDEAAAVVTHARELDWQEREVAVDRGVLRSFGAFFASVLGVDDPSGRVDTYADHVERGNCVLVVDAHDEAQAQRVHAMLGQLGGVDAHTAPRGSRPALRDIVESRRARQDEPLDLRTGGVHRESRQYASERAAAARATADDLDAIGLRDADKREGKPRS